MGLYNGKNHYDFTDVIKAVCECVCLYVRARVCECACVRVCGLNRISATDCIWLRRRRPHSLSHDRKQSR